MFSSISKSISQWSPKKLLARYLSSQLAEFFDVDADTIETNLVSDAHIKLQNVRIQPYLLQQVSSGSNDDSLVLVAEGWVDCIEFRWEWGTGFGQGTRAYIQDVQLRVQGVKLCICQKKQSSVSGNISTKDHQLQASPSVDVACETDPDWKARYLQQIMDHLTLVVESVEIYIQLPTQQGQEAVSSAVLVVGNGMELVTLGGSSPQGSGDNNGLRQRLAVGSLSAVIRRQSNAATLDKVLPLLDPFGYRAVVQRVSGRRFVDGIGAGLVIAGERILSSVSADNQQAKPNNALQVHAGVPQVACLLQLQKLFGFDDHNTNNEYSNASSTNAPGSPPAALEEIKSSLFVLPVEHMSLVLANDTKLRINQCVVTLRTDGSIFEVESPKGDLLLNGAPVNHTEAGAWKMDFVKSLITVKSRSANDSEHQQEADADSFFDSIQVEEVLTNLVLRVDQCRDAYQGLNEVMPLFDDNGDDQVTPWTFQVDGKAQVSLVSSSGKQANVILSNFGMLYIGSKKHVDSSLPGLPCVYNWDSVAIDSKDLGVQDASIPKVGPSSDGLAMTFAEDISVNVDSVNAMQEFLDFVTEFADILEGESTGVPLNVNLSSVSVSFREEGMSAKSNDVKAAGFDVFISTADASSEQGRIVVESVRCDTSASSMCVSKVSSASFGENYWLAAPLTEVVAQYQDSKLTLRLGNAEVVANQLSGNGEANTSIWDLSIPTDLDLFVQTMKVYERANANPSVELQAGEVRGRIIEGVSKLDLAWTSLHYGGFELDGGAANFCLSATCLDVTFRLDSLQSNDAAIANVSVSMITLSGRLCPTPSSNGSLDIPGLGYIHEAGVQVGSLMTLNEKEFPSMLKPLEDIDLHLMDGKVTVHTGPLTVILPQTASAGSMVGQTAIPFNVSVPLPASLSVPQLLVFSHGQQSPLIECHSCLLEADSLSDRSTFGSSCPSLKSSGFELEGLKGHLSLKDGQVDFLLTFDSFFSKDFLAGEVAGQGVQCSALVDTKAIETPLDEWLFLDGIGLLTKAKASVHKIESLSVDGSGYLLEPLTDVSVSLLNGLAEVAMGRVSWYNATTATSSRPARNLESLLTGLKLPCPVNISIPSTTYYGSEQAEPLLESEDVVIECTANQTLEATVKWNTARVLHAKFGTATVEASFAESRLQMKANISTLAAKDPSTVFSGISPSVFLVINTAPEEDCAALSIDSIGQLVEFYATIDTINELRIRGIGALSSPLKSTSVSFANGNACLKLDRIRGHDLKEAASVEPATASYSEYAKFINFPIEIIMQSVQFDKKPMPADASEPLFGFKNLCLETMPVEPNSFRLPFSVTRIDELWFRSMIKVPSLQLRGVVDLGRPDTVERIHLVLPMIHLSADFSSSTWSDPLTQPTTSNRASPLPFAKISEFDLVLSGKSSLLSMKNATLKCRSFQGSQETDTESVSEHYIQIVKERIPYLLTKADVLGVNVGDTMGMTAARTVMRSSLVGSVAGVTARDAVGGAISLGKQSRGAVDSQKYHFGDTSRGVMVAASLAAKKGSSQRGSTEYQVGDFAMGASSASAEYVSRNRERLGGAVGTSAAMIAGAAIAGPIGMIAGAVVGARAGRETVKVTIGEYEGEKDSPSKQFDHSSRDSFVPTHQEHKPPIQQVTTTTNIQCAVPLQQHVEAQKGETHANTARDIAEPDFFSSFGQSESTDMQSKAKTDPFSALHVPGRKIDSAPTQQAISRQPAAVPSTDPFSVFESSTGVPSGTAYNTPPDDPFAFFANSQPISERSAQRHATTTAEAGHASPVANHHVARSLSHQTATHTPTASFTNPQQRQQVPHAYAGQPTYRSSNPTLGQQGAHQEARQVATHQVGHRQTSSPAQSQKKGYQFGDLTRSVVSKGKEKRGGGGSDYKFGDFTRGLFG